MISNPSGRDLIMQRQKNQHIPIYGVKGHQANVDTSVFNQIYASDGGDMTMQTNLNIY